MNLLCCNKYSVRSGLKLYLISVIILIFCISTGVAGNQSVDEKHLSELPRYRVFNLKNISPEQVSQYLDEALVNLEYEKLKGNMISLTGLRSELSKAGKIIQLVDGKEKFIIKTFSLPKDINELPSNEKIAAQLGDILIGTLSEPPAGVGQKSIIDLQRQKLLVIAPMSKFNQIEKIITDALPQPQKTPVDANLPEDVNTAAVNDRQTAADVNETEKPDANSIEIVTDVNLPEKIDVNQLQETDVNDANLGVLFERLVDSLGKPAVAEPQIPDSLKVGVPVTAEINEPNITPVQIEPEKIQITEGPPPEIPIITKEPKTEDLNEPAALDMKQPAIIRSYQPEIAIDGNEILTIGIQEKMKIVDLLTLAGQYLNLNYIYDPTQLQGEVTIKIGGELRGKIMVKDLYPLVESVLKFKNLVMTRRENFVIIVPKDQAKEIDPVLIDSTRGKIRTGDVIISRIFELKHIDAESAKNLLGGMNLAVDINTSASKAGIIIVTGYAYRMGRVEELLNIVDIPGEEKQFKFRQLKYTMAATLKDKIKTLADQLGTVSITIAKTAVQPPPQPVRGRPVPQRTIPPRTTPEAAKPEAEAVYLDADERTNRILMIGLQQQLEVVDNLIDTLDVEQQDLRSLRVYEIQHVDAQEVTAKLQELGIISTSPAAGRTRTTPRTTTRPPAGQRITTQRPPAGGQAQPQVSETAAQEPLVEEPQVVILESTNSLLVNATAEQHAQIAMIIGYVDAEPEEASINYVVYPLENQDPEDLAGILNQLIQETVEQRDPAGKVVSTETARKTEEDITILADKNTFSIIVYASKKNQQWIESLIRQLDKRRPQVLIDVTLVEISRNDEFTLDLDLVTKYPTITKVLETGIKTPINLLSTDPGRRIWEASSVSNTGGKAFYADEHVQAIFEAMDRKNYGRILAKPKLLVNDNEVGTINTSETQTIVSPKTTVIPGSGTTNPTATVDVSTREYTAEIKLDITPHISEGDLLRLEITMTRTDFRPRDEYNLDTPGGVLKGPTPPDLLTSNVQTVITVPNQRTIILGGLEKLNQIKGGTKVPILGDIPLVGVLFRNVSNTDTQNRLYVFVKANILRPISEITEESDIVKISKQNRAKFESYEKEMQEYQDWPGIKPKPVEPVKILEED